MKQIIFLAFIAAFAQAALPPGYEDKALCPCDFCRSNKIGTEGMAGCVVRFANSFLHYLVDIIEFSFILHGHAYIRNRPMRTFYECKKGNATVYKTVGLTTWGSKVNTQHDLTMLKQQGYHELRCDDKPAFDEYACGNRTRVRVSVRASVSVMC